LCAADAGFPSHFSSDIGVGRKKLADALINGKAIQIEGGNFELAQRRFRCGNDGHEWDVPFEAMVQRVPLSCPKCLSRISNLLLCPCLVVAEVSARDFEVAGSGEKTKREKGGDKDA